MEKPNFNTELIKTLENEIKKLLPSFKFTNKTNNPLGKVVEIVQIATSTILKEKENLEEEFSRLANNHYSKPQKNEENNIFLAKNKLKSAHIELSKYQQMISEKALRLQNEESEFLNKTQKFYDEKQKFESEKNDFERKNQEIEIRIKALKEKEAEFMKKTVFFENEKKAFERQKDVILKLKEKIEENYRESEKIKEFAMIQNERINIDQERYDQDYKFFKEKNEEITAKQNLLLRTQEEIERKSQILEAKIKRITEKKQKLNKFKLQLTEEKNKFKVEVNEYEKSQKNIEEKLSQPKFQKSSSESTLLANSDNIYDKLRLQLEVFNQELSIKESHLEEKQNSLNFERNKMDQAMVDIKLIEKSLLSTKEEILAFNSETLPEIESIFNKVSVISKDLNEKYSKIEGLHIRMQQSMYLFSSLPENRLKSPKNSKSFKNSGFDESKGLEKITDDFEVKARNLHEWEKKLESQSDECKKNFESIKEAKTQLESSKADLDNEKEKIKIQAFHLDSGTKALVIKENELKKFKQELDKQAQLLKIKENILKKIIQKKNF